MMSFSHWKRTDTVLSGLFLQVTACDLPVDATHTGYFHTELQRVAGCAMQHLAARLEYGAHRFQQKYMLIFL